MFKKEKKDVLINIRVTKSQRDLLKKISSENNQTLTEFIFSLVQKYCEDNLK